MKKIYLTLLLFCVQIQLFSQSDCTAAQSHIVYAYSNAKIALEANNLTHLKEYSKKALEAFTRVKSALTDCKCESIDDSVYSGISYLSKVENVETLDDGRYYAAKGRTYAKMTINELDLCTVVTEEIEELSQLEGERIELEQQQLELAQKQEEIKIKMSQKQQKELILKKEQLIMETEMAISNNIQVYNEVLNVCQCDTKVSSVAIVKDEMITKSLAEIRLHYISSIKNITSTYMSKLNNCK